MRCHGNGLGTSRDYADLATKINARKSNDLNFRAKHDDVFHANMTAFSPTTTGK